MTFFTPPVGWAKTSITSLSYITRTTSTAAAITAPSSIIAGDLLVIVQYAGGNGVAPVANATPTGFTDIPTSPAGTRSRLAICYKVAAGTEGGTSLTGGMDDFIDLKVCWQYRANAPISALTAANLVTQATGADPTQQTISAASGVAPVLGIVAYGGQAGNTLNNNTTSITPNHQETVGVAYFLTEDYIQNSSPANYTFDMGDIGQSNVLAGTYLHTFLP